MAFADELVSPYSGRRFECGWSDRPQAAADIADRVIGLARGLGHVDPAFGGLRPDPGARKFRVGDQGPVVDMAPASLADMIDRRGRFDPPRFPAPVSPAGYNLLYRNDLMGRDPSFLFVSVRAGRHGPDWPENRVDVRPSAEHSVWRDPERGLLILGAMVDIWKPEWACAYYSTAVLSSENNEVSSRVRPWLAWTAKPLQPRREPPYARPYPAPFPLDDAGPPAEVRPWRGGELRIWP